MIRRMSQSTSPPTFSGGFGRKSKMTKDTRNIGREILEGLREIKRGDYGRVITIPSITSIREKTGLSRARFAQLFGVCVAIMFIFSANACASAEEVRLGMSQEEVVQLLGEPDRKAVLVGKVLRDLDKVRDEDVTRLRLVYFYEMFGLQVWFKDSQVTGVTRHGVSIR